MIAYVLLNHFLVSTYCIDVVAPAPEVSIPILVFHIGMPIKIPEDRIATYGQIARLIENDKNVRFCVVMIVTNTWDIIMGVFDLFNNGRLPFHHGYAR